MMNICSPDDRGVVLPSAAAACEVINCDVHPVVGDGLSTVYPYMPRAWRERFLRKRASIEAANNVPIRYRHPNGAVVREDARAPLTARPRDPAAHSSSQQWGNP